MFLAEKSSVEFCSKETVSPVSTKYLVVWCSSRRTEYLYSLLSVGSMRYKSSISSSKRSMSKSVPTTAIPQMTLSVSSLTTYTGGVLYSAKASKISPVVTIPKEIVFFLPNDSGCELRYTQSQLGLFINLDISL